jgi:hypothetical protein
MLCTAAPPLQQHMRQPSLALLTSREMGVVFTPINHVRSAHFPEGCMSQVTCRIATHNGNCCVDRASGVK